MNKKYIIASSIVAFAVLLVGTTVASAAFRDGPDRGKNLTAEQKQERELMRTEKQAEMEAHREAMQTAMENGDYNTWKKLIEEKQAKRVNILDIINEDNFDKLVEMHNLKQAGDMEGAKMIADELGLSGMGMGGKMGRHFKGKGGGHFAGNKGNEMPANN